MVFVGTKSQMVGFLPASQLIDIVSAPGRIRTADPLVRRENQAFLGVYKSIACGACQARTQSHQGTVMAQPVWAWHVSGTVVGLANPSPPGQTLRNLIT
jgi:hypothetical protein